MSKKKWGKDIDDKKNLQKLYVHKVLLTEKHGGQNKFCQRKCMVQKMLDQKGVRLSNAVTITILGTKNLGKKKICQKNIG